MARREHDEVRIWKRGSDSSLSGNERVRWAYAAFIAGDEALSLCSALVEAQGDRARLSGLLKELPAEVFLIGPEEIRELGRQNPGLRRALREARQGLRSEARIGSGKMGAQRKK